MEVVMASFMAAVARAAGQEAAPTTAGCPCPSL